MSTAEKDKYYVAVKLFLEDKDKLFIFKDGFGNWDLPGGRIKIDEFNTPLEDIIRRKINEELGGEVKYTLLNEPVILMRHQRIENTLGNPEVRIFAIGYRAKYNGGQIKLNSHHTQMEWVDIKNFKPEEYFTGGWLKGVNQYLDKKSK